MSTDPSGIAIDFDPTIQRMKGIARHGNTPFDVPFISEIAPNLWQGGCQDGLMLPKFIKHLISLYPWEQYKVQHELGSALTVQMYDSLDQSFDLIEGIASWVNKCRKDGPTLIHCQAGLNRSSLVACYSLMLEGKSAEKSIEILRTKRSPACLCNKSFEEWLLEVRENLPSQNQSSPPVKPISLVMHVSLDIVCRKVHPTDCRTIRSDHHPILATNKKVSFTSHIEPTHYR